MRQNRGNQSQRVIKHPPGPLEFMPLEYALQQGFQTDGLSSPSQSEEARCLFTFHQSSFESAFLALPACDAHDIQLVLFFSKPNLAVRCEPLTNLLWFVSAFFVAFVTRGFLSAPLRQSVLQQSSTVQPLVLTTSTPLPRSHQPLTYMKKQQPLATLHN